MARELALTYGESTKLSLQVHSAEFRVVAFVSQKCALVETVLSVCNCEVNQDIEAALRFPLPNSDAVVCAFRVGRDAAVAVPKAKAAAVAYQEREKGRAVATASNVSGATWETTVSPLPFEVEVEIAITIMCTLDDESSLRVPLSFSSPVARIYVTSQSETGIAGADNLSSIAMPSTMPDGLCVKFASDGASSPIASALCGDRLYWSGCIPRATLESATAGRASSIAHPRMPTACETAHIGLICDASRSSAPMVEAWLDLIDAIDRAFTANNRTAAFSLWAFSRRAAPIGIRLSAGDAQRALAALRYDGGTNLSLLGCLLTQEAACECEAIVLLTDGVNNLLAKQMPDLSATPETGATPVHIPLPPDGTNANLGVLRWIAHQTGGSAVELLHRPDAFATRLTGHQEMTHLTRLRLDDLSTDIGAFEDAELQTVPDFRLQRLHHATTPDGDIRLTGECNVSTRAPPTSLTLTVRRGSIEVDLTLPIPPPSAADALPPATGDAVQSASALHCGLGRLLQVQHAQMSLHQIQMEHYDMGHAKIVATELACAVGIASEHSSLLKLSLPEQFADHGIECPPEHAAHADWKLLLEQRQKDRARSDAEAEAKAQTKMLNVVAPMANRYAAMVNARKASWGQSVGREPFGMGGYRGGLASDARTGSAPQLLDRPPAPPAPAACPSMNGVDYFMADSDGEVSVDGYGDGLPAYRSLGACQDSEETPAYYRALEDDTLTQQCGAQLGLATESAEPGDHTVHQVVVPNADMLNADSNTTNASCGSSPLPSSRMAAPPPPTAPPPMPNTVPQVQYMPSHLTLPREPNATATQAMAEADICTSDLDQRSHGSARASSPHASRQRLSSAVTAKVASVASHLSGLFYPSDGNAEQANKKPKLSTESLRAPKAGAAVKVANNEVYVQHPWLLTMQNAFQSAGLSGALTAFDAALDANPSLCALPSTFIACSEALHGMGAESDVCADMLFNVLETNLPDTQTCRVVAYHLLEYSQYDDAVHLLELVQETLAPAEPHSFTDLAFARFHRLRQLAQAGASSHVDAEIRKVVADLTRVIVSTEWAGRFREIEWPCMILLSWAVAWAEHQPGRANISFWPEDQLPAAQCRVGGKAGPQLDVFVWLGWDTDHTDVDLHVKEPTGEEVCYSHNRSATTGACVSRDFTDGYGPEVYTLPSAPEGMYVVKTNYYASHQASTSTGSTSAVLWSIKDMGRFDKEEVQFASVRLRQHKQQQEVLKIKVS